MALTERICGKIVSHNTKNPQQPNLNDFYTSFKNIDTHTRKNVNTHIKRKEHYSNDQNHSHIIP